MIIKSLLDVDFYKFTMARLAWEKYRNTVVEFGFKNRTSINLLKYIPIAHLIYELNKVRELRFTEEELDYLKSQDLGDEFVEALRNLELPPIEIEEVDDGKLSIKTHGKWYEVILWETIVLSVVNELYYKNKYSAKYDQLIATGTTKLMEKVARLMNEDNIYFTDFGTRRRFSREWQENVVASMKNVPGFVGTSNVYLAMKYDLKPIGTFAHEMPMISAAINSESEESLVNSHSKILNEWWELWGERLSTALTDTWGTEFFFRDFKSMAKKWKALRHDSGDPFEFGDKVIEYYEKLGIDPMTKSIIFSDGLSLKKIIDLSAYFLGKINVGFGWGTQLTNDMGVETLSIVMKAIRVLEHNGIEINKGTVKLSDNLNKSMGSQENIDLYVSAFDYHNTKRERLIV